MRADHGDHGNHHGMCAGIARALVLLALIVGIAIAAPVPAPPTVHAGVYFNDVEYTYKEYWADHASYTAGCGASATAGNSWYIEPEEGCAKSIELVIPDDTRQAIAAVVYVDLWRNRPSRSARFTINDGPQFRPLVGQEFSRTPFSATVPLTQLRQGANVLRFQESTGPYHVHDAMVRVYYDASHPLIPGPGSDVTPPNGELVSIRDGAGASHLPAAGGRLDVDTNQVALTATASGASAVEFHAYYDGFDEDNDGQTRDWHNFLRNNFGPGGTSPKANGATIGHLGTDTTAPYETSWNLAHVTNQTGVRFKIRVIDAAGNVREAAGGASAEFALERSYRVERYTIEQFTDRGLFFDGAFGQGASDTIVLPDDLAGVTRAILVGNYWNSPDISINDRAPFAAYVGNEDTWSTSRRDIDVGALRPGANTIRWNYRPPGFGAMVEGPGPMLVLHRTAPTGAPVVTTQPVGRLIAAGQAATLTATASGASPIAYQWLRNGSAIPGATSSKYVTPALSDLDDGAHYRVRVTNPVGSATSAPAVVNVAAEPAATGSWWNDTWSYRTALTVFPDEVARVDKVVTQSLDFTSLMAAAGAGGPTFDPNSIRVVEVDSAGTVVDADVPFQFDPSSSYEAGSNAVGTLVWQLTGTTPPTTARRYHVYFDKTTKQIPAASVAAQVSRTATTDEGFAAYRFDLADGSSWYFHHRDGGGFSSIVDRAGADWLGWNSAAETAGDFRGLPNAVKSAAGYMHPGRAGKTTTTILREGPLRITFQTVSKDNSWIAVWDVFPTYATFRMTKAASRFWFLYEGLPGGEIDAADFVRRSDGTQVPIVGGSFESDLPGREWMYVADPADDRSLYIAHHQDDGAVESYRLLDGAMPVLGFGRGGLSLNYPYLRTIEDGRAQTFTVGLTDGTAATTTSAAIDNAERPLTVRVGSTRFVGTNVGPRSDDFSGGSLDPMWSYADPVGDVTLGWTGTSLTMSIPAGASHDVWSGRDRGPRIVQQIGNTDLDVVVGFGSTPTVKGTGQGILIAQDASNWIRYSVEHDGTQARVAVYQTSGTTTTTLAKVNLSGVATRHLRVTRSGTTWTFQRSFNGSSWTALPPLTIGLAPRSIGVIGISHATPTSAPFLVDVDYFESKTAGPFVDDAPRITDVAVDQSSRRATVSWTTNVPADSRLSHGPTIDITKSLTQSSLETRHSVTIDYLRCGTPYFVRPTSASASGTTVGAIVPFTTQPCASVVSDDFSSGRIAPHWRVFDPVGDAIVDSSDTNAIVSLPAGSGHNLFVGDNRATRLRQEGPVGDFGVEAKFDSVLTSRFQMEGIVVEQDAQTFLRFEIHHDGSSVRTYAASIANGVATTHASEPVAPSANHHLRVTRIGDVWTMWHSPDGSTWTKQAELTSGIDSVYVGPYIGNTATGSGSIPAFVGSIDYFFDVAHPIDPEDGGAGPDVVAPVISSVAAHSRAAHGQSAEVSWTTDELATTRVDWGTTTSYAGGTSIDNRVMRQHTAKIAPLNCGTTYHYRVVSTDPAGNTTTSPNQTMTSPTCPNGAFSDNFDAAELDPRWFVDDRRGDGTLVEMNGLLGLTVPAGVRHDLSATNNGAFRVLQAVKNGDFQVRVGFESVVNFQSQIQGVVFEQDANNLVRFDLFSDGTTTKAFVGTLTSGPSRLTTLATVSVPGATPGTLRVTRAGTTWTFEYSPDHGATWQVVHQGTIGLSVARVGPIAGNANAQLASVPAHTALVDYFWTTSDPIEITRPGAASAPQFTIFGGNGTSWAGEPLRFGGLGIAQPDVNVLGRVVDPDGIASITYSVNGGEPVTMGLGTTACTVGVSCTRRLALDGDFNADIPATLLRPGPNTISIRAVDNRFNVGTIDVPVIYEPGRVWPMPYTVDWAASNDLHELAQPIDGRWHVQDATLRIDEIGYDRLLAVGDQSWTSFEAEVPITIEAWDPAGYAAPSGGPGIGFIPHWNGHLQVGTTQPKYGFGGQLGALVWYRYRNDVNAERLEIRDSNAALVAEDLTGIRLAVGTTYVFKLRAEAGRGGAGPTYSLKVWPQGSPEPAGWQIKTALPPGSPSQGSLALVAHHVKARFGRLSVRQVTADAPTIAPGSKTAAGLQKVTIASGVAGAEIRYTMDGTTPTLESAVYTEPFLVDRTTTVRARVFRDGFLPSATTSATYTILPAPPRVTDQLQALYRFDEGAGSTVADTSFAGDPVNLTVVAGSDVTWLADRQAIAVNGPSAIRTLGGANRINTAIKASQAFSVELWIDPASTTSSDATLVNIATEASGQQNFALTQQSMSYDLALRTTNTDSDGRPPLVTGGLGQAQLHHLVYTRATDGATAVYVDGEAVFSGSRKGSLNSWANGYALALANSIEGTNPWTGDLYLAAVYSSALSPAMVEQNFRSGPWPTSANYPPVVDAGPDIAIVQGDHVTLVGSATDDGRPTDPGRLTVRWSMVSGPAPVAFADATARSTAVSFGAGGSYVLQLAAFDGEKTTIDQVVATVVAAGTPVAAPVVSPPSGPTPGAATVTMSTSTPGATIHYTLDGSAPTASSSTYTGPFSVTTDVTIRAVAFRANMSPSPVVERTYIITQPGRVGTDLLALYAFNDANGATVADSSGFGSALDLTIGNIARTTRVPSGLTLNQATTLVSGPAQKLNEAISTSGQVTLELWVTPKNTTQSNAMLFGISANSGTRNTGVVQAGSRLDAYVRSTASNTKGEPGVGAGGVMVAAPTHIVFTRDASGTSRVYVNGVRVTTSALSGTLASWVGNHQLHLGGERDGTKSWLGTYYLVAVYGRALDDAEVLRNFAAGDV